MIRRDNNGVSPIISGVLLLLIMISIVGAILAWGVPMLTKKEADNKYDASLNYFKALDATIDDLIYCGNGTTRTVNIAISDGNIFVEEEDRRWLVSYSFNNKSIYFSGLEDKDGIFEIEYEEKNLRVEIYHPNNLELGNPNIYNTTTGIVDTDENINGTIHAKIYSIGVEIAEFWLFDIDSIVHKMPAGFIKVENAAVTTNYPELGEIDVKTHPLIIENNDESVSLSMLQLSNSGIGSGGSGNYAVTLKLEEVILRQSGEQYNLTIQIFGDHKADWYNYIHLNYNKFTKTIRNDDDEIIALRYDAGESNLLDFKLMQYKIDVKLEGR